MCIAFIQILAVLHCFWSVLELPLMSWEVVQELCLSPVAGSGFRFASHSRAAQDLLPRCCS